MVAVDVIVVDCEFDCVVVADDVWDVLAVVEAVVVIDVVTDVVTVDDPVDDTVDVAVVRSHRSNRPSRNCSSAVPTISAKSSHFSFSLIVMVPLVWSQLKLSAAMMLSTRLE